MNQENQPRYPDGTLVEFIGTQPVSFEQVKRNRKEQNFWARQAALPLSMWRGVNRRKSQRFSFAHGKGD